MNNGDMALVDRAIGATNPPGVVPYETAEHQPPTIVPGFITEYPDSV